jgi:hypothetical protein
VSSQPEPPVLIDGRLTLGELVVYARLFDDLSQGQPYSARDFLEWVRLNLRLETRYRVPAGRPGKLKAVAVA